MVPPFYEPLHPRLFLFFPEEVVDVLLGGQCSEVVSMSVFSGRIHGRRMVSVPLRYPVQ